MESPRVNNDGPNTPLVNSHDRKGTHRNAKWSKEFDCLIVNGILAPIPLSAIRMERVANDELQEQISSPQDESSKKKQKIQGNKEFFFKLYKFPNAIEQYLLETHEVDIGKVDSHHVKVSKRNGKWNVGIYNFGLDDHVVIPVLQDPSPPIFPKKYELSLDERLIGWIVEKRKRCNGREDKFYYHYTRQFRSFVDMTAYVLYSCKVKDLQIRVTNTITQQEAEVSEAKMTISSSDESRLGSGKSIDDYQVPHWNIKEKST